MNGIVLLPDGFSLSLDTAIYNSDAIKKTAYKFADRASIIIQQKSESSISVLFNFVGQNTKNDPKQVIADFCNELLDQDLREIIKRETTPLRNVIIAQAFSRTNLAKES